MSTAHVTDRAVLRWLERVEQVDTSRLFGREDSQVLRCLAADGIDVESRRQLIALKTAHAVSTGARECAWRGVRFCISGARVTTVLTGPSVREAQRVLRTYNELLNMMGTA